jgi:glucosamine--fructose-6-phosphate aminotransferase (isomerizing)
MSKGRLVEADIAEQPEVLRQALAANADAVAEAQRLLARRPLVRLLGIGSSRHAAGYGAACLDVLAGIPAAVLPAPGAAVARPPFMAGVPVVVLSQSGRTPALLDAAAAARQVGAPVVAVTNEPGSPLEQLADVTLACSAGPERVVAATKSVTAQAVVLRAVAGPVDATALDEAVRAALALDFADVVHGPPPAAVVCGGFAAEWVADEIALKFAEMAGRTVGAEPLVEHLHGPVAAGGPVLAFVDPSDPNAAALPDGRGAVRVAPPRSGDPSIDAIATLVLGQRLALAWARHLGEDADAPRGLQKVTATR